MSNSKKFVAKNGVQTQNIDFVSNNESNTISFTVTDEGILSVEGDVKLSNSLYDSTNSKGNVGEVLVAVSEGLKWQIPSSNVSGFIIFDGGTPFNNYTAGPVFDAGGVN
jgi:hypothetical protein